MRRVAIPMVLAGCFASIWDADWSASMQKAAAQVIDHLPKGCIPVPVADPMHPDCHLQHDRRYEMSGSTAPNRRTSRSFLNQVRCRRA
jgi:hypothetical protein